MRTNRRPIAIMRRSCSDSLLTASQSDVVFGSDSLSPVLERVEAGHDIFCSSDFERDCLEAQDTSRCLHLAHFQHRTRSTDIGENRQVAQTRDNLAQQLESLTRSIGLLHRQASNVSAGSRETG